ncbi:glucose-1-phosphate thymidylyltransferase [Streptomyces sp. NPDC058284]|uniref:glucose-1-phosphate thymidylyltransferase n=1 Tax=unclassified Streptomyces TaxID=2593676 RepID=UPI00365D7449
MKALVLSGGSGTRLRPFTHTSAKQLVPVANKPVLFYGLEAVAEAGITEVGLVVGSTEPEIRAAVGDGKRFGLRVTYLRQARPLGVAHALLIARDFLQDDDFVLYLGDTFLRGGITEQVEAFRAERPDARVLLAKVADPTAFGVAELDADGRVVSLEEKPSRPRSDLALVGVYLFTPAVHAAVRALTPSARGELEITDALRRLIDHGATVSSARITDYWKDTGSVGDLLEANSSALGTLAPRVGGEVDELTRLSGQVTVEPGARLTRSTVLGPAIIGAGSQVTGSYLGPYVSVAERCLIRDSVIENSIVLGEARIEGAGPLVHSLIGRHARITRTAADRSVQRLVLGDHSEVSLQP